MEPSIPPLQHSDPNDPLEQILNGGTSAPGRTTADGHLREPGRIYGKGKGKPKSAPINLATVALGPVLNNIHPPRWEVQHEDFVKRQAVYYAARGCGPKEIAKELGYDRTTIGNWYKQPWFQRLVLSIIDERGRQGLDEMIQSTAVASVLKLVELRDDPETPKAVQANISMNFLDRIIGKPVSKIEVAPTANPSDLAAVERELAAVRNQNQQLLAGSADSSASTTQSDFSSSSS